MTNQGYYLPGLYVCEGSIPVPLDWAGSEPGVWRAEDHSDR